MSVKQQVSISIEYKEYKSYIAIECLLNVINTIKMKHKYCFFLLLYCSKSKIKLSAEHLQPS